MTKFLRSQDMEYCHLMLNEDSAWEVLNEIGEQQNIHFIDPDPNTPLINRPFANYIKRCEDVEQKLSFFKQQFEKFKHPYSETKEYKDLLSYFKSILQDRAQRDGKKDGKTLFSEIEEEVNNAYDWLDEQLKNFENISEQRNQLKEYGAVLFNARRIIGQNNIRSNQDGEENPMGNFVGMNQIIGVIDRADGLRFERMVFRVTKGNCFIKIEDIDWQNDVIIDPKTMLPKQKLVFVIIFPTGDSDILKNKLNRVCDTFNCARYGFPADQESFLQKMNEIEQQKRDNENIYQMTNQGITGFIKQWIAVRQGCNCSKVEEFSLYTLKEKSLYTTLNYLRTDKKVYQGNCWVPSAQLENITQTLQMLARQNENGGVQIRPAQAPKSETPPTHFVTNDFTGVLQVITDTYGIPTYKEINPSLFNIMTFPFLFGVMFGDIGHGGLLMLFGLFLVLFNNKLKGTAFEGFAFTRYFVFFMGFFACYCGFMYNDFMSLSLNLFGSCYDPTTTQQCGPETCYGFIKGITLKGQDDVIKDCVYPFGLDPIWAMTSNSISYLNSYKMKLAVIIGVLQMLVGIVLKGMNAIYFKLPLDFFFEFIPQFIFLSVTFGYMDWMIIYKWFLNFQGSRSEDAPNIITLLINMPLAMGRPCPEEELTQQDKDLGLTSVECPYLYGTPDMDLQSQIQILFLLIAVIMIPIMLLVKPLVLLCKMSGNDHKHNVSSREQPLLAHDHSQQDFENNQGELGMSLEENLKNQDLEQSGGEHEEEHGFGEIFVHSVIETIEFVLGSISNTASYLRLWALSLAHSQLADVFFENGIAGFLQMGGVKGGIALTIGYFIFALITFGVLMCMDVMECFLHALRLHWVEFQSKFYKAEGIAFTPFSFQKTMEARNSSEA